jgi:hypothetical protein
MLFIINIKRKSVRPWVSKLFRKRLTTVTMWAGQLAPSVKIKASSIPNGINYCAIFLVYKHIIYKYGRGKHENMAGHMRPAGRGLATHKLDETNKFCMCQRVWQGTMLHPHSSSSQPQNAPIVIFKKITKRMEMNWSYLYPMCATSLHW